MSGLQVSVRRRLFLTYETSAVILTIISIYSKPAQLEGLEVDQYMWGILNTLNTSDVDEVTIDSGANWKATKISANPGIKVRGDSTRRV